MELMTWVRCHKLTSGIYMANTKKTSFISVLFFLLPTAIARRYLPGFGTLAGCQLSSTSTQSSLLTVRIPV